MKELTIEQLADAYEDYFSVEHGISINAKPIAGALPTAAELVAAIPPPFLLASDVNSLNGSALRSLNRLGELADELANYLQQQARKIDLLLHYVLKQQDNPSERFTTQSYSGSGCCYLADAPLAPLQTLELKLFLANNDGAVFCYGQVVSCESVAEKWQIKVVLSRIRDEDRELIVRASLHQQSRLLKQKAEQRQQT
ncbi:PilZ domain-containing protein [Rheinheimera baltica]|uniref:PilZ domain-containing protein n=1 Tax=Rheinheimera baltica TaxID=67576 RepID=UPI00273FE92F|nr:PilZ domain-containing protein [Rheinheimera baltica]MDP5144464.1 PilZ domain-containing protein [Rheinheimera baltica]MDP5149068.1 PilZ domain-containing protein [Rheinheimera baltica]